jgi:hypothetical protein
MSVDLGADVLVGAAIGEYYFSVRRQRRKRQE